MPGLYLCSLPTAIPFLRNSPHIPTFLCMIPFPQRLLCMGTTVPQVPCTPMVPSSPGILPVILHLRMELCHTTSQTVPQITPSLGLLLCSIALSTITQVRPPLFLNNIFFRLRIQTTVSLVLVLLQTPQSARSWPQKRTPTAVSYAEPCASWKAEHSIFPWLHRTPWFDSIRYLMHRPCGHSCFSDFHSDTTS